MDLYKLGKFWLLFGGILFLISLTIIFLARKKSIRLSERATNLVMVIPVVTLSLIILFTVFGLFQLRSKLMITNKEVDSLTWLHMETTKKLNDANYQLEKTQGQRDSAEMVYVTIKKQLDSVMVQSILLNHQSISLTNIVTSLHLKLDSLHSQFIDLHNSAIKSKLLSDSLKKVVLQMKLLHNDSLTRKIARLIHANDSLISVSEDQKKLAGNLRRGMDEETSGDNAKSSKDRFIHYSNALYYYRMSHIPTADNHYKRVSSYVKSHRPK